MSHPSVVFPLSSVIVKWVVTARALLASHDSLMDVSSDSWPSLRLDNSPGLFESDHEKTTC